MKKIIAKTETTVYFLKVFEDGSRALMYDNGSTTGVWCSVSRLRSHLIHLQNIKNGSQWKSMIPSEWEVIDNRFFTELGIE